MKNQKHNREVSVEDSSLKAKEAAKMNLNQQDSLGKNERLDKETIKMLFRTVFPPMSNLVIFNLSHFCEGESTEADQQFREALDQELFRRGLVTTPDLYTRDVNVDKFSDEDLESVNLWFDSDLEGCTAEDNYVRLLTGRDRWAERQPKKKHAGKKAGKHN
jgi:hypothetical protein